MSLSDALSAKIWDVEQLRGFIGEVTREVTVLQGKFDHQEELICHPRRINKSVKV